MRRFALSLAMSTVCAAAGGAEGAHRHAPLHFEHPLIAESPSPDTKLRGNYSFRDESGAGGETHVAELLGEYAFRDWLSVEASVPYLYRDPDVGSQAEDFGSAEVAVKAANFTFAQQGLLLGGGLEMGLPTGDGAEGIGSNHIVEIEPFVDFGYKRDRLEVVGFLAAGFPTNENEEDEADTELGWNLSVLYHLGPRFKALLELDGVEVHGGEEDGTSIANVSPGIKWQPWPQRELKVGAAVSLPLTDDRAFDARSLLSVFQHF